MAPYNFWPALFIGLSVLYVCQLNAEKPYKAALFGFLFSLGYFGFGLSWIGNALLVEGNPYWWAWPLAVSGLPILLSMFAAFFCFAYKLIFKKGDTIFSFFGFVFCLFLADLARSNLFTGFPWNLYAYTWVDTPSIAQAASIYNIYILHLLTIFWASLIGVFIKSRMNKLERFGLVSLGVISFFAVYFYGISKLSVNELANESTYSVVLVQPNIKQSEKWKPENRAKNFETLIELSLYKQEQAQGPFLIVWPETAISQDLMSTGWVVQYISNMLRSYPDQAYLVAGALRFEQANETYHNSIVVYNREGEVIHIYDKHHLVPFGEYMPLEDFIDIAPIVGFSGFQKGSGLQTITLDNVSFSPLVCYEAVFPGRAIDPMNVPDLIINVTNDAWYGESAGPYQHLAQVKFRAIETGIPVVRVANTGISAFIDKFGRETVKIPLFKTNSKLVAFR